MEPWISITILDEKYSSITAKDNAVCHEIQTFMYAVLADQFKTNERKKIVSQYESDENAQGIYCELMKKHAKRSTVAQI
jgi:hypothetical protein